MMQFRLLPTLRNLSFAGLSGAVCAGVFVLSMIDASAQGSASTQNSNCSPKAVPTGQANPPGSQSEPMAPIWCFTLNPQGPPTRSTGANDWVDTFAGVTQMGQFNDGDLDYRVYDGVQNGDAAAKTQHFTNNSHWMDDNAGGFLGGTMIRPNRSFKFENGKLIVEADVAAGISGYAANNGADVAWPEIDISTADSPNGRPTTDPLYAYGRFGGFDTFGCRLHATGNPICAYQAARAGATGQDTFPCFEFAPARLIEISWFEGCGGTHDGGYHSGDQATYFRQCSSPSQVPDMMCRDRFRIELAQDGMRLYVNGLLYMEDTGWPGRNQLPASITNGSTPVYVYMSDWQDTPSDPAYRFHWARFAVNPHATSGTILPPSASPSFCLGMPMNTCDMTATTPATPQQAPTLAPSQPSAAAPNDVAAPDSGSATMAPLVLLGEIQVQSQPDVNPPGYAEAFRYLATHDGTATRLNIYVDGSNEAAQIVVGLYGEDSADNRPGTLLGKAVINSPTAEAWNTAEIPAVAIASGASYWIAVLGPVDTGPVVIRDVVSGGDLSQNSQLATLNDLPETWSEGKHSRAAPMAAYADIGP